MKLYYLHLKSYTDAPDYEEEVYADSITEAIDYFYARLRMYGWEKETIAKNTVTDEDFNKPLKSYE